ncbi:hypothetical protein DPMN_118232 [Dreissena polymorpha]|uniref:Uncharacterized protein n=1 Tax=Dreissena polymorpha TaxID=45954 RepID=A0A9D4JLG9_DREPO|nr:hypothetical protein DPMN_118232 [Dreissena polymorpha]
MGPYIVEIDCIVIKEVQYQFEVNQCRDEEIIVKGNFGWAWPMWTGRPRVGNGAMHKVQYQFEVTRCRNEEIIVKGNFGWAWPMWAGCPRIDRIVIRKVQYQFEVNRCRNEEIIATLQFWVGVAYMGGALQVEIDRIVIREVRYQYEENRCRNEEIIFQGSMARTDGRTDRRTTGQTVEITTISPRFSKSVGITIQECIPKPGLRACVGEKRNIFDHVGNQKLFTTSYLTVKILTRKIKASIQN